MMELFSWKCCEPTILRKIQEVHYWKTVKFTWESYLFNFDVIMSSDKPEDSSEPNKEKRKKHRPTGFEEWGGYMATKKMKLNIQFEEQKDGQPNNETKAQIFKGISIFVNGYTKPPADELKKLMVMHGGKYHHYYITNKTTHVIASNLPHSKMKNLKTQTVVTADWITDSIKAGKLLPHQDYLLYTPEQVDKQHRLQFKTINSTKSETTSHLQDLELEEQSVSTSDQVSSKTTNPQLSNWDVQPGTSTTNESHQNKAGSLNTSISPSKSGTAMTAKHPDFLSEFYNNSRLHHISTAGQELKRYVQELAEKNKERNFPSREKLRNLPEEELPLSDSFGSFSCTKDEKTKNVVMHLDMDCFFVSVGLKKHPELRGLPVAVTHAKGKRGGPQDGSDIHYEVSHYANESKKKIGEVVEGQGHTNSNAASKERSKISIHSKEYGSLSEIASCSYEARKAGLRNGMFLGEALRRCPDLKTIPYDFEGYAEVSKQLYNIVAGYTLDIEAVSCDELYIDCKELLQDTGVSPTQFASILRSEIEEKTGCTASAGIGSNMLMARLANKVAKPNGQHHVHDFEIENFMKTHKVGDLPGVGYTTSRKLEQLGAKTCSDLQAWSLEKLQKEFGPKTGQSLFDRCRGNDSRSVQFQKDRKSVSAEINYGIRFETEADVFKFINDLSVEVHNRLQSIGSKGKSLTLKLMVRKSDAPMETAKFMGHGVCDHLSKSVSLKSATDSFKVIANECCTIARSLKIKPQDFRGVGIQMSKLESSQKEIKVPKIMKSFLCQNKVESKSPTPMKDKSKSDAVLAASCRMVNKSSPNKTTIKHFLSSTPFSEPKQDKTSDFNCDMPSQSFLDALPEDIKEEVLRSCQKTPTKEVFDPGASTSRAVSSDSNVNLLDKVNKNNLDQSVLNALPEELRKEVLESYNASAVFNTLSPPKTPPTSYLYVRRKPITAAGPKILADTDDDSDSSMEDMPEERKSKNGSYVIIVTESNELKKVWSENPEIEYPCVVQMSKKKTANLGGAFELDDIRSLLREWVNSTDVPFDDDVNDLNNFFDEAVEEKSFYKVEMLLKYLHRLAKATTNRWKEIYLTVLSNVQKKMKEKFDCELQAYENFPP
ncbi:hypothetical protein JTE90_027284 [Oedothorax gibbosus]|uniref:DNA repair protein REV1 n=1 Tax=Oedothorax gibbosus TaxID=931172 RepID=A0AAV6W0F3_9ARAC|nr:hypothetical protein JTE90_027284 [Oedothorax gibbosus]